MLSVCKKKYIWCPTGIEGIHIQHRIVKNIMLSGTTFQSNSISVCRCMKGNNYYALDDHAVSRGQSPFAFGLDRLQTRM